MVLVIVVAAVVALILLGLIMVLGRSRFADESERFRYVSDLTSQWSRQRQEQPPGAVAPAATAATAAAAAPPTAPGRDGAIDLRDVADGPAAVPEQVAGRERR